MLRVRVTHAVVVLERLPDLAGEAVADWVPERDVLPDLLPEGDAVVE